MSSHDKYLLHVAIDFGTTFSGYACRFKQQEKIWVNNNWGKAVGYQAYKVPTCVLTKGDSDEFVAFGFEAQSLFSDNSKDSDSGSDSESDESDQEESSRRDLHFYDEFKMMLQGDQAIQSHMKLTAYDGHKCEAIKIFAMALNFLKNHLLVHMEKIVQEETIPKKDEIKWILTVPAIWSDGAKQFMRNCAVKAEIISNDSSDQLLIALEPEAASLYCRTLPLFQFELKENVSGSKLEKGLPRDSHYMVVDCGGGTVDVTAHHYKRNGDICELYAASGGGWGGRNINRKFENKLNDILGKDIMEKFKSRYSAAYLDTKINFEKKKKSIDFSKTDVKFNFTFPYILDKLCKKMHDKDLKTIVKDNLAKHHVDFSMGNLKFTKEVLYEIFKPSINDIKTHILELVAKDKLKDLGYIYLVGGFSDCSLLQHEIKEAFATGVHREKGIHVILAPQEASLAVVKGAVLFGSNPHAISSRRARQFYCTGRSASKTSKGAIRTSKGTKLMKPIIRQNEEIDFDDVRDVKFFPKVEGNIFELYHYKHGSQTKSQISADVIDIDLSNVIGTTKDNSISIYLSFGSTEIHVTARNDKDPQSIPVTESINCLMH